MTLAKKLTGTLTAGSTSIVFTDPLINNDSIIEVYTQSDNVYPADISQSGTSVNILFDRQSVNVGVAIMVINLTQLDDPEDISITDLSDVVVSSLTNGQILSWNGTKWVNVDLPEQPTVPEELSDLDDVNITTPTEGQILKYNGTTWVNDDAPSGGEVIYSTTEQVIGKWIDGRNIYKITFTYSFTSLSGSNTTIYTASEDITLINAEGIMRNNNNDNQYILPYSNGNNTNVIMMLDKRNVIMRIGNDSWDSKFSPLTVTIYYLKDSEVI